jgi:hypothetical protein
MSRFAFTALLVSVSLMSPLALAKNNKNKDYDEHQSHHEQSAPQQKEPWLDVKISTDEQRVYQQWCQQYHNDCYGVKPVDTSSLPPGLRKKVERGGSLPPGWQKKLQSGSRIDPVVYASSRPLPPDVLRRMPPPQPGTVLVTIDGKLVRLMEATMTILDVFDVGR